MRAIVDTGPLVAFFDRSERSHHWAVQQIETLESPLLICEPVLAETMFLLSRHAKAEDTLLGLLENGAIEIAFRVEEHVGAVRKLLNKFHDVPMSLADACIVRMSELNETHTVLTLDSDFRVYRRRGKEPIPVVLPD